MDLDDISNPYTTVMAIMISICAVATIAMMVRRMISHKTVRYLDMHIVTTSLYMFVIEMIVLFRLGNDVMLHIMNRPGIIMMFTSIWVIYYARNK